MGTKDQLIALLEENGREFLSGEQMATKLGVSRAAVWKAVNSLREQGLPVESAPGGGYRLAPGADWLDENSVQRHLEGEYPVRVFDEVDSTNLAGKRWAIDGAPHGALLVAGRQTQGRGRLGRHFVSPPGGLYLSVVLRPRETAAASVLITAAAAVAVCRAVSELCGIELSIKWVNDLFVGTKKCCGILTEAGTGMESGSIEYMVVGIGINLTTRPVDFGEARETASSLYPGGVAPVSRAKLAARVHQRLLEAFDTLETREFLTEYRDRSLVLGKMVTVMVKCPYIAKAVEIDDEARLVVEKADGRLESISYGEISVKM